MIRPGPEAPIRFGSVKPVRSCEGREHVFPAYAPVETRCRCGAFRLTPTWMRPT